MSGTLTTCRVWQFERADGTRIFAVGADVSEDADGFTVAGEFLGHTPYQVWMEELRDV